MNRVAEASPKQWRDNINTEFLLQDKANTTILFGGLTILQDQLIAGALNSLGENYRNLPNPDLDSFQIGKSFGNRGQCNPTYFTVGNLVKYLQGLRDNEGVSTEEIVKKYVYVTAGGCGPCRFGMYVTEYRKALRDAGFEGFRVFNFEHNKGIFQGSDKESGINFSPRFFITLVKAVIIGDIINILGYKIRPYELDEGATDKAIEQCRQKITRAFMDKKSLVLALRSCKKVLQQVKLNRLQVKAKVMVMGEFWAAITEGDGNYGLHRFLESEGAECIPQPMVNRLMLSLWEFERDQDKHEGLKRDGASWIGFSSLSRRLKMVAAKSLLKAHFSIYAKAIGLSDYELPNMEKLADLAKDYYPMDSEGGEAHLEVAHLIESIQEKSAHLVISVKPFGCMPSSSVSDGIQSLVTSRFPESNFLAIETSGEGAVNFYSRVQMALFKAKKASQEEYESLDVPTQIPEAVHQFTYQPKRKLAGTAADLLRSL